MHVKKCQEKLARLEFQKIGKPMFESTGIFENLEYFRGGDLAENISKLCPIFYKILQLKKPCCLSDPKPIIQPPNKNVIILTSSDDGEFFTDTTKIFNTDKLKKRPPIAKSTSKSTSKSTGKKKKMLDISTSSNDLEIVDSHTIKKPKPAIEKPRKLVLRQASLPKRSKSSKSTSKKSSVSSKSSAKRKRTQTEEEQAEIEDQQIEHILNKPKVLSPSEKLKKLISFHQKIHDINSKIGAWAENLKIRDLTF